MLRKIVSIVLALTFLASNLTDLGSPYAYGLPRSVRFNYTLARYNLLQCARENPEEFERLVSELAKAWIADAAQKLALDGRFPLSDPAVEAELVKQAEQWAREASIPPDKLVATVLAELSKLRAAQPRPPAVTIGGKFVKSEIVDIIGEKILWEAYRKNPDNFKLAIDYIEGNMTGFFSSPAVIDTLTALLPHLGRGNIRAAFANSPFGFALVIRTIKDMGENRFLDTLLPQVGAENFRVALRDDTDGLEFAMEMIQNFGLGKFLDRLSALSSLLGRDNIERAFRNHPHDLLWVITRDIPEMGLETFVNSVLPELMEIFGRDTVSKIFSKHPRYLFMLHAFLDSDLMPRQAIIHTEKLLHTLDELGSLSIGAEQLVKQIILDRAHELHRRGNLNSYEMRKLEETLKTYTIPGIKVAEHIYRSTTSIGAVIGVPVSELEYVEKEKLKGLSMYLCMLPMHATLACIDVEKGELGIKINESSTPILAKNLDRYIRRGLRHLSLAKVEFLGAQGREMQGILKADIVPLIALFKSFSINMDITKLGLLTELYLADNPDYNIMTDDIRNKLTPITAWFRDRLTECLLYMKLRDDMIKIITGQGCNLDAFKLNDKYRSDYILRATASLQKAIKRNPDEADALVQLIDTAAEKVKAALIGEDPLDKEICRLIEKGRFDDVIPALKEACSNAATRERAKELLQIAESGAPPRGENPEWEPAAKPASEAEDVERLTRETDVHMLLRPEGWLDLSKIAIVAKEGLVGSFTSGKDAVLGKTLEQEYKRMSQTLRKLFGNGKGIVEIAPENKAQLPDMVNSLISQGFKVIVLDDGALTEGLTESAIRGKRGEAYCVISAESEEGLGNTTIQFLNLNAMALMGVGILHNDEILFETAYRLFTGIAPPESTLTSLRRKALWLIEALPMIIKFTGGIDDSEKLKRLFRSSA